MDAAGYCSPTQTVSCTYVVTRPIGISKSGLGTVGVYTNGQLLELGTSYSLTATPAPGFTLLNWTYQGADITFFYNGNIGAVLNGPPVSPTVFTLATATTLSSLQTYHWNVGRGKSPLGTLSLSNSNGTVHGPWQVVGLPGQGGVSNAYWKAIVTPNILLEAGTYTVIDSDPSTWSQNSGSLGKGFAWANAAQGVATTPSFTFIMQSNLTVCANFIDTGKPMVAITAPTAAQRIVSLNPDFTVRGTAGDIGAGVTEVRCQINSNTFVTAIGTNAWSCPVTLTAGLNTIKAYSRDAAGNCSPTQTVSCTYVVTTPIGISKTGLGTVGIYTNGQLLEIGTSYMLTATPAAGCMLQNWTTNNIVAGTSASLVFVMRPNLTVCANFIDTAKPTVAITSPTLAQRITAAYPAFTVRGTAGDIGEGVTEVRCQINSNTFVMASGTTAWSSPVTLTAGLNTIRAYSQDAAGNCSPTQTVSCTYVVTTPIGISKTGKGTVGIYTNGQPLEIGASYTLTATPGLGFSFINWTYKVADVEAFYNGNSSIVNNGPTSPTVFTLATAITLSALQTYHWNNGSGKSPLGTLSLSNDNGTVYGPWPVTGYPGQGGVINAYWQANPNIELPAGTYTVIDSDPSTWSQNSGSSGKGIAWVIAAGRGDVIATTASFSFTMRTNLSVCANFSDTGKPTVVITAPTAAQRILAASPAFTVCGTAGDSGAGVTEVRCQINSDTFVTASGTNAWNCPVTLTAGLNTIRAYSRDAAGNCSPTQTVSCTYVVTTPIQISKTGLGTVGIYTNGQPLEIGTSYTLTATPAAGCMLLNWTTNNIAAGTSASLGFVMQPNLTVCANFIDTAKPTVAITSPTAAQRIVAASPDFTVRGIAGDIGSGVESVWCQLNSDGWMQTSGLNAWSRPVTLAAGLNTVKAYSMDAEGNCSPTQTVSCTYVVTRPIGISKTGLGTVGVYTNGQLLELGTSYTLTATPAPGFALQNWTYQGADITFFYNGNIGAVGNGPTSPTVFTLATEKTLTSLQTYHWNGGRGASSLGTLSLSNANGTVYGPWSVTGYPGQGGVPNAYWKAIPNILLEPGTYTIIDSDPSTWSQNAGSLGKGFAWANAAEGIATTPSFTFIMQSNLTVCANFIDIGKPAVVIASPTAAQRIVALNPDFTVRGTASDIGAGVVTVDCQINNGEWQMATGTNVWTNIVTLVAGSNTIKAYSRDAAGNCSPTASVVCTYVVTTPIGISKTGMGTVGIYTNGQLLEIGTSYTLTAMPAAGYVLRNWTTNDNVAGTALSFTFIMQSNLTVCANFIETSNLNAQMIEGLNNLSQFADTNSLTRGQSELVASAAANFDLVARNNPNNYTNRIYNAMAIMLNLINNPVVRSQVAAFGLNLNDLFDPTCVFPTVMPSVDLTVDNLAVSVLPAVDKAYAELNAIPATWPGMVEISPEQFPIDEAVWIDIGDVTAMKAALKGLRAFVELLKAYNLNVDYRSLYDPTSTPQASIVVDGGASDWTNVTASLSSVKMADNSLMVTQEVAVALDGNQIALLMKGCLFEPTDIFQLYFTLRLSNGDGINTNRIFTIEMLSDAQGFDAKYDGQQFDNFEMELVNGVLEVKFPIPDMLETSQVTVEAVEGTWSWGQMAFDLEFPGDVPIKTIRANQPEFFSKVRNTTSLAAAKPDVLAALNGYLAADTLIANRSGINAQLLHFVDFDASDPEAVEDRQNKKLAVETIRTSLNAIVLVEGDSDIEGTATRPVYLGAFFNAPYITTNIFPSGLRGTINNPVYDVFPDPTFHGILPGMTTNKLDKYLLGYTYVSVETMTDFQYGPELNFYVDTDRKFMVITNITVSGPGIPLTTMTQWNSMSAEWNGSVKVGSKLAVGSQYTFTVYFLDGSRELLYGKIKAWMAFSSIPTLSGTLLQWPAVAGAARYEVWVGNQSFELPATQTSLNLAPYGYEPGYVPSIWIQAVDENWNRTGCMINILE
jgi:hypothetical protein